MSEERSVGVGCETRVFAAALGEEYLLHQGENAQKVAGRFCPGVG
jgi:hypothetical protein